MIDVKFKSASSDLKNCYDNLYVRLDYEYDDYYRREVIKSCAEILRKIGVIDDDVVEEAIKASKTLPLFEFHY